MTGEDDHDGEGEVAEVDGAVGFGAEGPAEASERRVGSFDDPAVAGEVAADPLCAFAAAAALRVVTRWGH